MSRIHAAVLAVFALPVLGAATLSTQAGHYHVTRKLVLGRMSADYIIVDDVNRRLYGLGDQVIDVDKDTVIGKVEGGGGGYAIAADQNRGLVRNGTLFDLKTLA